MFFDWDTQYAVTGTWALTRNGRASCVTLSSSSIVPISGDPQPGPPRNTDPPDANGFVDPDVLGWGYTLDWDLQDNLDHLVHLIDLLPDNSGLPHSVVTSCEYEVNHPANGKFDAPWMAVGATSTAYVGDEHGGGGGGSQPTTTPPAPPGPGPTTTPPLDQLPSLILGLPHLEGIAQFQRRTAPPVPPRGLLLRKEALLLGQVRQ